MNNAFIDETITLQPTREGALTGYTFAVKDVFDVKGHTNAAGNPTWLATHEVAITTAPAIETLLAAGATLQGMTHTDELMYSLNGENIHYGTPINPLRPNSIPGGSSSGSAVAVASKAVDFALGTDTGGSVRIPSSYCGLYGIRPTHGVVNINGVIPLASQFDTVGWMARDASLLLTIGDALLTQPVRDIQTIYVPEAACALAEPQTAAKLKQSLQAIDIEMKPLKLDDLYDWSQTFRLLQGEEIWQTHGKWVAEANPVFGPDIADRFKWASTIQRDEAWQQAKLKKQQVHDTLQQLLGDHAAIAIPTTAGPAPEKGRDLALVEETRTRTMQLSCIAGLSGLPQVTMPVGDVGLSFIGGAGQDMSLLQFVRGVSQKHVKL